MLMPNQQLAQMASAVCSVLSVLTSGVAVPLSVMAGPFKRLAFLSVDRYTLAGMLYHLFSDCRRNVTPFYGEQSRTMEALELDVFNSAGKNAAVIVCFYLFYTIGGFLCLRHLHRERR